MASSGVSEVVSERKQILDYIVLEMYEGAEQRRIEWQERIHSYKAQQKAGELIRTQALGEVSRGLRASEADFHASCNDTPATTSRKRTRRQFNYSYGEESHFIRMLRASRSTAEEDRERIDIR